MPLHRSQACLISIPISVWSIFKGGRVHVHGVNNGRMKVDKFKYDGLCGPGVPCADERVSGVHLSDVSGIKLYSSSE